MFVQGQFIYKIMNCAKCGSRAEESKSKAVFVFDMPVSCYRCPLVNLHYVSVWSDKISKMYCRATGEKIRESE